MSLHLLFSTNRPGAPTLSMIFGVMLVGAMLIPVPTMAQGPTPLTVMRRAIEAFESTTYDSGYVVLETAFPHTVHRVVPSLKSARAIISAAEEGMLTLAGPLSHAPSSIIIVVCRHTDLSEWICPRGPVDSLSFETVDSLELFIHLNDGSEPRRYMIPGAVDAIVLTPSAMDKFVWPYLARYGLEYAVQRRREYLDTVEGPVR